MGRVTQQDVAKAVGLTRATVSYVLGGRSEDNAIPEATKAKILEAARRMGYHANESARSLKTKQTLTLAMVVPDLENPFYPMQIKGAQRAAQDAGYRLIVVDSDGSGPGELDFLQLALRHVVDGLLLSTLSLSASHLEEILALGIPCVGLDDSLLGADIDMVVTDQADAVSRMIGILTAQGHRRIGHLTGTLSSANGRIRRDAWQAALVRQGLGYSTNWCIEGTFQGEGYGDAVVEWYQSFLADQRPTALFAANDLLALDAIRALRQAGISVPRDLSVCGFDDIPAARYAFPSLTTIRIDNLGIGHEATRILLDRIAGRLQGDPVTRVFSADLVVRESTEVPR